MSIVRASFSYLAVLLYASLCDGFERDASVAWDPERFRDRVEDFFIAHDNSIWVQQEHRLTRFSLKEGYTNYYERDGLPSEIKALVEDNNDGIWCFGIRDNQFVASIFDGQSWNVATDLPLPLSERTDLPITVFFDRDNNLWIGTKGGPIPYAGSQEGLGLFLFSDSAWTHYSRDTGLLHNDILDLAETPDGSIWVATVEGINRFKNNKWTSYTQEQGLLDNATYEIAQMPDGAVWAFHHPGLSILANSATKGTAIWHPADDVEAPADLWGAPLETSSEEVLFPASGPGLWRYAENEWTRLATESGFPEKVNQISRDTSGAYWILSDDILRPIIPQEPESITIQGVVYREQDRSPWAHSAVWLETDEAEMLAWTRTDSSGRYKLNVFKDDSDSTSASGSYHLSAAIARGDEEIDLEDISSLEKGDLSQRVEEIYIDEDIDLEVEVKNVNLFVEENDAIAINLKVKNVNLFVEESEPLVDSRIGTAFFVGLFLVVMALSRYKGAANFLANNPPLAFILSILALVVFYGVNNNTFIAPALMHFSSLVWSLSLSFLIKFAITNQILPRFLLRTNSPYAEYHYYNAKAQSWSTVPIFPAIFCLVMLFRYLDDPALMGPLIATSILVTLYSIMGYVLNVGRQCRSTLRLNIENRWLDGHFRFLVRLGFTVLLVTGSNAFTVVYSFGKNEQVAKEITAFSWHIIHSAVHHLRSAESIITLVAWIALTALVAKLVFTPGQLAKAQQRPLFFRNLVFSLSISSYIISILLWVHIIMTMNYLGDFLNEIVLPIIFPCFGIALAAAVQWYSRRLDPPESSTLEPAQFSSNKWLSGTIFILCLIGINIASEAIIRVEESLIISVVIFFFLVWNARRRIHLENIISQRTIELEAEKALVEAENVRKTTELEDARRLQLSMLPQGDLDHPDIEIAFNMKPASEVGGDYFDFSISAASTLTFAIGDATGHGLRAGILVTATKSLFQALSSETNLRHILTSISQTLKNMNLKRMNMALTLLRISNRQLTLSSAGMPPVLLYRADTKKVEEILLEGMPLGISKRSQYTEYACDLQAGDTLLLMSDGLPERQNSAGDLFDYDRVQEHFAGAADRPPEDICTQMWQAGEQWSEGRPQDDDVTLVAFKVK